MDRALQRLPFVFLIFNRLLLFIYRVLHYRSNRSGNLWLLSVGLLILAGPAEDSWLFADAIIRTLKITNLLSLLLNLRLSGLWVG